MVHFQETEIPGLFTLCVDKILKVLYETYGKQFCPDSYFMKVSKVTSEDILPLLLSFLKTNLAENGVPGLVNSVLKGVVSHTSQTLEKLIGSLVAKCGLHSQAYCLEKSADTRPCHYTGRTRASEECERLYANRCSNCTTYVDSKHDYISVPEKHLNSEIRAITVSSEASLNTKGYRTEDGNETVFYLSFINIHESESQKEKHVKLRKHETCSPKEKSKNTDHKCVTDLDIVLPKISFEVELSWRLNIIYIDVRDIIHFCELLKLSFKNNNYNKSLLGAHLFVQTSDRCDFRIGIARTKRCFTACGIKDSAPANCLQTIKCVLQDEKQLQLILVTAYRKSAIICCTPKEQTGVFNETIILFQEKARKYLISKLTEESITWDDRHIYTGNVGHILKIPYYILTKGMIRNLLCGKHNTNDTKIVAPICDLKFNNLAPKTLSTPKPALKDESSEAPMSHRNIADEVGRIKSITRKGLFVSVKCENGGDTADQDRLLSRALWKCNVRLKMSKPETDIFGYPFMKKYFLNESPDGFIPCKALRTVRVNMLRHSVHGFQWHVFERTTMRLASFAYYPKSAAKSASLLANAGFVYIGDGSTDKVRCFFCSAEKEFWQQSDNIDEVHMSLCPSCPMVTAQSTNNVASVVSSHGAGSIAEFSSAMPCDSELPVSSSRVADNSAATGRLPDPNTVSRNNYSGNDEIDSLGRDINEQSANVSISPEPSSRTRDACTLSVSATASANPVRTGSSGTQTASLSVPDLPQEHINVVSNNTVAMTFSSGQLENRISEGGNVSGNQNSRNTNNRNPTNYSQENRNSADLQDSPRPTNINSQIYAIPPRSSDTSSSEMSASNPATSENTTNASNSVQPTPQLTYQLLGIFHERPKYAEYAVLARRMQSFDDWPEGHPIKKEDLARSGLFFAGYGDCCRCFFCGGGLRNWEVNDDPFVEHARWFEMCSFIRQFMGLDFVEAVQSLKNRGGTITLRDVTEYMMRKGQTLQNLFNDRLITDDAAVKSLIDAGYSREAVTRVAVNLRESGEILSADLILRHMMTSGASGAATVTDTAAVAESGTDEARRLQVLKDQNYALRNNLICKICMDKEVKIVFLPCGHLVSCQECAIALQNCPVCRKHIRATARANIN